jgi:hypothetical protein
MASQLRLQKLQQEGRNITAITALQRTQFRSGHKAAAAYFVPQSTLQHRLNGRPPRLGERSKFRLLQEFEEEVLVSWIYSMEIRGFPPHLIDVKRMAQSLIDARGTLPPPPRIGKNWLYKWINKRPDLDKRLIRTLDSQRYKQQDPQIIGGHFERYQSIKQEHDILDEDTYNFDETGFAMGVAHPGSAKVLTTASVCRACAVQPGNREWCTTIEACSARGWRVPPMLIFAGKVHIDTWYRENPHMPRDWDIQLSYNGWTNDEIGLKWIQHFDKHTRHRTVGTKRLLVLDGHGSHATPEFDQYCLENGIITVCMPSHSSHICQPLDVGCFGPLKQAYSNLVLELARLSIFHVNKEDFIRMYLEASTQIFKEDTIKNAFSATGLVPFNPARVLDNLTYTAPTPSPPPETLLQNPLPSSPWRSETPRTHRQLEKQHQLIQNTINRPSQSPTEPLGKIIKSAQLALSTVALLVQENHDLRVANTRLQKARSRRRRYIQEGGGMTAGEAQNLIARADADELAREARRNGNQRAPPTCSGCGILGHNIRSCRTLREPIQQ